MLDRRAEAQLTGDERAYLADLDESNDELVAQERMVFANLQQFPLADLQYLVVPRRGQQQDDRYWFGPVVKVIRLSVDDGPDGVLGPGEGFLYAVARRNDGWAITDITPYLAEQVTEEDIPLGLSSTTPLAHTPWNLDRLHVVQAGNVWLAGDDTVTDLDRYAAVAEAEAQRVEQLWGDRPRFPGHVMFFTRTWETLGRWFELGRFQGVVNFRGFAIPEPGVRADGTLYQGQLASARMAINLGAIEEDPLEPDPTRTMRHELVHAVTARARGTGDSLVSPARWAVEGFARFIDSQGDAEAQVVRAYAAQQFDGGLPETPTFYEGDARTVTGNYAVSATIFQYLEQIRDLPTAIEFYDRMLRYDDETFPTPVVETPAFDGVCLDVVGIGASEFLGQWADFARRGA